MRVKIIKCSSPEYWYSSQVGSVFSVKSTGHNAYELLCEERKPEREIPLGIDADDCEILPDETPQLEPFDLERALNGEKVVCRNGESVDEIHLLKTLPCCFNVICVVGGSHIWLNENGRVLNDGEHKYDLLMAPKEPKVVTKWINIYKYGECCSHTFETLELARQFATQINGHDFVGTFPIQITLP